MRPNVMALLSSYRITSKQRCLVFVCLVVFCITTVVVEFSWLRMKWAHFQQTFEKSNLMATKVQSKCSLPVQDIMFLKAHKTGSSTLTNVLNRYADYRRLTVVLPQDNTYTFDWPERFQLNYLGPLYSNPNILCNHARFNKLPLNILLPKERTKYITLLREPVAHYESVFYFFNFGYFYSNHGNTTTINQFLSRKITFIQWRQLLERMPLAVLARNPQMFDLGLHMEFYQDITAVNEYINFLDGEFDVVLILEHFDESLVLMKRLFCWEMKDILYIKQMERLKSEKNREVLTKEVRSKILSWNQADAKLYRHFNNTLWKRISFEGPGFYEDLKLFREELQHVKDKCLDEGTHKTIAYGRKYVLGHRIKPNVSTTLKQYCEKMLINEIDYLDYFRKRFFLDKYDKESTDDSIGWEIALDLQHNVGIN